MIPVFDSNIIIDHLNLRPMARKEIERYGDRYISAVTWIEVLVGIRTEDQEKKARALLQEFIVVETDVAIREMAVIVRQQKHLRLPDAIILATAKVKNTLLVTRNTKDFDTNDPSVRVPYTL